MTIDGIPGRTIGHIRTGLFAFVALAMRRQLVLLGSTCSHRAGLRGVTVGGA